MGWGEMAPAAGTDARRIYDVLITDVRIYKDIRHGDSMQKVCWMAAELAAERVSDILFERLSGVDELENQVAELQIRVGLLVAFKSAVQEALDKHDNPSSRIDQGW